MTPCSAAALDEDHQLLGRDPLLLRVGDAEQARDRLRERRQQPHQRREDPAQHVDRHGEQERQPLGVGEGERLGHELAEEDREQRDRWP